MNYALPREDVTAGLLAAAVHGFFVLLLVFGLSWQIHDPQPIMAELWQSMPEPSRPAPIPSPQPTPAPQPQFRPQPVPENKAADIALEKKKQQEERKKTEALALEERRKEKLLKQKLAKEEERKRKEELQSKEEARRLELELQHEAAQLEAERVKREQEKKHAELKRREDLQREEEELQQRMLDESLAREASQIKAKAAADQRASEVSKIVAQYKDMISAKVRGNTRLPDNLAGNPEAEFEVSVLPTGEITKVKLTKGSGNAGYDQAVQRGIEKSTPLPLPTDKSAAAEFRNLLLKHKARE